MNGHLSCAGVCMSGPEPGVDLGGDRCAGELDGEYKPVGAESARRAPC